MRFRFKRGLEEDVQTNLNEVSDMLQSGYFLLIDLFFWAFLLTVFTKPVHHSILLTVIVYIGYYMIGVCLLLFLRVITRGLISIKKRTE